MRRASSWGSTSRWRIGWRGSSVWQSHLSLFCVAHGWQSRCRRATATLAWPGGPAARQADGRGSATTPALLARLACRPLRPAGFSPSIQPDSASDQHTRRDTGSPAARLVAAQRASHLCPAVGVRIVWASPPCGSAGQEKQARLCQMVRGAVGHNSRILSRCSSL